MSEQSEAPSEGIPAQSDLTCSFERSVQAADSTLKQLATTKETFSNFEAFYKKFVAELNEVREEHRLELYKCQTRIDDLLKEKTTFEEQLCSSRKQAKKYKEELAAAKRKQGETEWENEKQAREISSLKVTSERLKTEKNNLELEVTSLRKKLGSTDQLSSLTSAKEGENSMLDVAKQEIEQLESRYRLAMKEKEALHVDIVSLQKHMGELQIEYKYTEKELQTRTQNANVKAYKADMQLKNITRQKKTLTSQFEECQKELKKAKDRCLALERQKSESQEMTETYKDEINVKRKQLETLNDLNQTLENKLDVMSKELCTPEVSNELLASPDEFLIQDLDLSESKIQELETSLQSTRNEKQDLERDVVISGNKITGLEESNQRSQEEIRELERHLAVARNNASALETELFKQTGRCTQLQGELNQLREQEHNLKSQLIDANQRNTEMERKLEQALEENDEVKENASLADRKVADLIELVKRSENSNSQLEEKLSTLKNQVSKFEGQNESNMKQIAKLKMEAEAERGKKENVEKELLVMNSRLDETQRSTERINRENEIKEKFSGELKKVNKTNEEKLQHLNENLGTLEAKLEVTEEEKRELHQEALDSQHRINELEADNNFCVQEKDRLDLDIQQLCKKINGLQSNLNVCEHEKNEFEHQVALLQQKVRKYEVELSEIMKNNADLEVKIQEAISSTCQSNDEIAGLKRQGEEHRRAADEIGKEVAKKDKKLEKLREKIIAVTAYSETVQDELANTKLLLETRDKEKNELQKQLVLINDEVKRVKDMENIATKQKEQLEGEVEMLREKLQGVEKDKGKSYEVKLTKELEYERAKANQNQKKLDSLKSKIGSLETETGVSKKDVHAVTGSLQLAEETILNLSSNLERSLEEKNEETRRLYLLENRLKDMEKDLHLSQTMKDGAEEEVCAAKKKIAQLEAKVDALDKNRNLIKDQWDAANDNLMNKKEEIMRLKSKVTEQDKTNEYLNHVISKKDHVIQESRDRVRTCEADLDEVRRTVRKYQVTTEGLKAENMEYEKRYLLYQENIRKMEKDIFKQREVNNTLNQKNSAQTLQLNNLQNKISSLHKKKDHYKNEHENAQESIRRAKQQLLTANHRMRENEIFAETNSMKLNEKENSITRLRESKIALETELICAKTDLETLRRHFEQSEEKVKDLEQSLEEVGVNTSRSLDTMMNTLETEESHGIDGKSDGASVKGRQSGENVIKGKLNENQKEISVKDEKIKSLNRRISDMESEIRDLKSAKNELDAINESFEKEKRELKRELLDANGKMSDLEVKIKYECQEKSLAESLLNDSRKRTNEMQEKMLKLQQQIVELKLTNEKEDEGENPAEQVKINAGEYVLQAQGDNNNTIEKVEKVTSCQKNLTDKKIEEESNDNNLEKEEELSEPEDELSKWKALYEITSQRKSELEKEVARLQKEYEEMRQSHKETLSELESAKEHVKTMSTSCNGLELDLEKAVKSKVSLEKQLEEREIKLRVLEDRVGEACLKLEEAQRKSRQQSEEKCFANEAIAMETFASPLLQNAEKMLDRNGAITLSEENEPKVQRQEGQSEREGQLVKEIEELRVNNEELKKEIYHLQARETLGEIRKASHKNFRRKLGENELNSEEENEKIQSQESDLSSIKMAYDTLIDEILKVSEHLENYQLNVFEWEANHDLIEVANERLLSCFSALQNLFCDLDSSFKELNESINASDSNTDDWVPTSMGSSNETTENQISGQDISEKMKNRNSENDSSDDNIAKLRDEICGLKKDNTMLKECNDKLIKTVKELEKKVQIVQEEPQATEVVYTASSENVIQSEQGIELHAPPRDGGEEGFCEPSDGGTMSHTSDRYSKAEEVCSKEDVTSKDDVTKDYMTSEEDVTSEDNVPSKEDVTNKDDVTSKEDMTNKDDVTSKDDVTNKDDMTSQDDLTGVEVTSKRDLTRDKVLPTKEGVMEVDYSNNKNELHEDENRHIVEDAEEKTEIATESETHQLWQQEETDSIDGKPSTRLSDEEKDPENTPSSKKSTSTPRQPSEDNIYAGQNDKEGREPGESYLPEKDNEVVGEKEKLLELELTSAKQKIKELESLLQSSAKTLEDGDSESVKGDENMESGKAREVKQVNENTNEKSSGKNNVTQRSSTTPHEGGDAESVKDDENMESGKAREVKQVNENTNEKSFDKKDKIQTDSTTPHEGGDSESVKDDENVGNANSKEKKVDENVEEKTSGESNITQTSSTTAHEDRYSESVNGDENVGNAKSKETKVDEFVGEKIYSKKDEIQELQEQNQELKSQVKHYKDYKEKVEALIYTLRNQVTTLQKELEKYRSENLFGFKTRNNEEFNQSQTPREFAGPTRRLFSDNKGTSSPRLRHFPLRYDRATTIPINSKAGGWRAMSTPKPDRKMEFEHSFLPEISSLNLAEDFVPDEGVEEMLESSTADEQQDSPSSPNESGDKINGNEKGEKESGLRFSTKDSIDVEKFEHEGSVDEKQNDQDSEKDLPEKTTDNKDMNDNVILEDKETKSTNDNDIESIENEFPNSGNEKPLYEGQQASTSRDQEVSGPSVGRNSFRSSNLSMPNRSGLGVVPVYIGHMNGRGSYRANKSASRTYPFTRKYY